MSDPEILKTYGEIDSESGGIGRRMGKNDVWIAASAHVSGATQLTTDQDFDRLNPDWINCVWIDPKIGKSP